jgi:diguanylate cyclase (GGDEF)-like protein
MRRVWIVMLLALLCAVAQASPSPPSPPGTPAAIERLREPAPGMPPDAVRARPEQAWTPTGSPHQLAGATGGRGWWRLHPPAGGADRVLLVYHPYSARLTVLAPPDYRVQRASIFDTDGDAAHSRRALVFALRGDGPVYIGGEDLRYPLQVAVRAASEYAVEDHAYARVLWLSLGILIGVSLVVLLFWTRLRERVYLLFAASMGLQLLYVLLAYGDAYGLPGLSWLARFDVTGIWFVATASTMVTVLFLLEFAELHARARWLSRALWVVGALLPALLLLALVSPWPADKAWFPPVGNGLLLLANLLAIATLVTAWLRGGRHAGFVLVAWVPLVAVSTARAMQLSAGMPLTPSLEYGLPVMEAFAALVLVLGLADRMLTFRRERDVAQSHADHDALTGVFNRGGIVRRLDDAILHARRHRLPLSVLFLDLDHFKRINDNHGHPIGDACLAAVTEAISAETQAEHLLGRMGGEEFLLLLPSCNRRHARDIGEQIRRQVEINCRTVRSATVALTLSIGVVECGPTDNAASLIQRADEAMYQAKHQGRNRVVALEPAPA